MIEFSIPGYWRNFKLNMILLDLKSTNTEYFNDGIEISSVYGSFPCVWNGGRYISGYTSYDNIVATLEAYKKYNVSIRHTFTNNNITDQMVYDTLGNSILNISKDLGLSIGVNVGNDVMFDYITEKYPEFYILWSTTMAIDNVDEINKLSEKNIVVPYYGLNNDFGKLSNLCHKENIELLIGEACMDACPHRQKHYQSCNATQCYKVSTYDFTECELLGLENGYFPYYKSIPLRKHFISFSDIKKQYEPLGFTHFKISGRNTGTVNVIENYVNWLIKDEHKDHVRNLLLNRMFTNLA